jgi:hypothetical protein
VPRHRKIKKVTSNSAKLSFIREYIETHVGKEILPEVGSIPKTDNPLAVVSHFFLNKATKTLDAICVLCEADLAEDALVLGRTILELCLYLQTIALPDTSEQQRLRAESLIYDGDRQRVEKLKELATLKQQGKCLSWINDIEAENPVFQTVQMPSNFVPLKKLKTMATELGGEWECWYHFIYWSISKLTHPSGLGSHTYFLNVDQEQEVSRAITVSLTMHFFLTVTVLGLVNLERLRPPLEKSVKHFIALSKDV